MKIPAVTMVAACIRAEIGEFLLQGLLAWPFWLTLSGIAVAAWFYGPSH